ncbi:hypothetical protein [Halomicrobium salinisoli]|uniref:hypothetical protein n=1 Tax=Halomicrobium salinisoli TaxID=2878391 RepID=UPI001CEFE40F|nr:hypothetical protein [Halomicrobium salinisoli]
MSLRTALVAGLDALPFAVLAAVAAVVFGRAGGMALTVVVAIATAVGLAILLVLGSISANRYRTDGRSFHFTRIVVSEGLFSLP